MASVGDILTGRDGEIKLVGVQEGVFVAEHVDEFGPPFRVSARELVEVTALATPVSPVRTATRSRS